MKNFGFISIDGICKMPQIEWWLLKHHDKYRQIHEIESKKFWFSIDGENVRLPPSFNKPSRNEKFLNIYDTLNRLSNYHRNENYFKQEIAIYKEINDKPEKVNQWLLKNEKLGSQDYVSFLLDYLDYDTEDHVHHLNIFFLEDKDLKVFVEREDFKFTIEFLEIFDELYWE